MAGKMVKIKTIDNVDTAEVSQFAGMMIEQGVWCVIDCKASTENYKLNMYQRSK